MITYGIDANALLRPTQTGVERYVARLLAAMQKTSLSADERVRLYVARRPDKPSLPEGWEWRVLPFAFPRGWTHIRLSWELRRRPPTVFFSPAHEVPLGVGKKTRVVSTVHDLAFDVVPWVYPRDGVRRQHWAIRRAVKKARKLLAISETTRHDVQTHYKVALERIALTRLGVDAARFAVSDAAVEATLRTYRLARNGYLFYVGRLEEKKNIVTLLRGFAECKRTLGVGHPLMLVLAGDYGFGKARIVRALQQYGRDVLVTGFVPDEDIAGLMKGALALCFASHYEGFGLPVLEAFAAGTPVIASDIPAFREVAGDAALFASPHAPGDWAQAMHRMVLEAATRAELAHKGSARVGEFGWDKTAAATWEALRAVAK